MAHLRTVHVPHREALTTQEVVEIARETLERAGCDGIGAASNVIPPSEEHLTKDWAVIFEVTVDPSTDPRRR